MFHSVGYLLKQLSEFGIGEAVNELEIRNRASALELVPDAVKNVAFGALNHRKVGEICAEMALVRVFGNLFPVFEEFEDLISLKILLIR